ncbi:hypothetical protein ADUPG1_001149, partial [Aduncisulcus paluster]
LKSPDYSGLFSSDLSWSFILIEITKAQHYHPYLGQLSNSPSWAPRSWICYPKSLCSEAWSLFHPVISRFAGEFKRVTTFCSNILEYFANLCYDPSHAVEVFESIKDYLDLWFEGIVEIYRLHHKTDPRRWSVLFALLSTNSSLIPYLSPKYDETLIWALRGNPWSCWHLSPQKLPQYPLNVSSYLSTSHTQKYFHSIPFVCLIPTIETFSSQLPYEERSLRQSLYDFVEQTSAGVELLFDEQTCSFEGYDQDEWRKEMEDLASNMLEIEEVEKSGTDAFDWFIGDEYARF